MCRIKVLIQLFLMNFISDDNKFSTKPNNQVIYGKLNHTKTINLKNLGAIILVPLLCDRHLSINSSYVGSKTMPKVICLKLGYPNLS